MIEFERCCECGDPTHEHCEGCGRPTCGECATNDDAGSFCEGCGERLTAESLEAVGGERLTRAIAAQERWEREAEGTT